MPVLPIVFWPDKLLSQRSEKVTRYDAYLEQLSNDMAQTMYHASGIGLAAIQVGVAKRLVVVDPHLIGMPRAPAEESRQAKEDETEQASNNTILAGEANSAALVLVNPRITEKSKKKSRYEEGCLSFPGFSGWVERYDTCTVAFNDIHGASHQMHCEELLATCVQHEIDHLNGKMFFHRMSSEKRQSLLRRKAHSQPV